MQYTPVLIRRRRAYGALCGCVGIGLNVLLFLGKLLAGVATGSLAVTADAVNNLSDAGSSVSWKLPTRHIPFKLCSIRLF